MGRLLVEAGDSDGSGTTTCKENYCKNSPPGSPSAMFQKPHRENAQADAYSLLSNTTQRMAACLQDEATR